MIVNEFDIDYNDKNLNLISFKDGFVLIRISILFFYRTNLITSSPALNAT